VIGDGAQHTAYLIFVLIWVNVCVSEVFDSGEHDFEVIFEFGQKGTKFQVIGDVGQVIFDRNFAR
jgi:hypothetical protein